VFESFHVRSNDKFVLAVNNRERAKGSLFFVNPGVG